jgi:NAD(P)-dependent dehydrogenase (short-subunit alcohol dehydrogenase family)
MSGKDCMHGVFHVDHGKIASASRLAAGWRATRFTGIRGDGRRSISGMPIALGNTGCAIPSVRLLRQRRTEIPSISCRIFIQCGVRLDNSQKDASNAETAQAKPLSGKSILVSGGASGLGAALCKTLSSAGAGIVVGDINIERAEQMAEVLGGAKSQVYALRCDVGHPAAAEHAINATAEIFGKIDVLINNAGTDVTCSLDELSFPDWDRVIHTNLYGPFLLSKYAARYMRRSGRGQIINIASTAAKRAWPNASAYHASKWGLLGLSHALHAELRPHNIKVTAVIAGGMCTPFLLDRFPDIDTSTLQDPLNVAQTIKAVLLLPDETVIPEIMVLPMRESSWP